MYSTLQKYIVIFINIQYNTQMSITIQKHKVQNSNIQYTTAMYSIRVKYSNIQ